MRHIASILLIIAVIGANILAYIIPVSSFDYSAYRVSTLKEIGDKTKATATKYKYEAGVDFYVERLKVRIPLTEYPGETSEGMKRLLEFYFKTRGLNLEHLKLFTHQINLKDNGYSFVLVWQGQLTQFLEKEARLGDYVNLYVVLGIYDIKNKRNILLVNEFDTDPPESKKG